MEYFASIIYKESNNDVSIAETLVNSLNLPLNESTNIFVSESINDFKIIKVELSKHVENQESVAQRIAESLFECGMCDFDIEFSSNEELDEETYDGNDFYEAYGDLWYNDDEIVDEAEYQGRKVKLGKPMRGDVKKFKVYVKNPKGNVVKVNFGDPDMKIKKSNPARRKSFRARHNCDNPGPRHRARYWSCRKW